MPFYKNLGPISYEAETTSFEIFNTQEDTCIFQSKYSTTPPFLFEEI